MPRFFEAWGTGAERLLFWSACFPQAIAVARPGSRGRSPSRRARSRVGDNAAHSTHEKHPQITQISQIFGQGEGGKQEHRSGADFHRSQRRQPRASFTLFAFVKSFDRLGPHTERVIRGQTGSRVGDNAAHRAATPAAVLVFLAISAAWRFPVPCHPCPSVANTPLSFFSWCLGGAVSSGVLPCAPLCFLRTSMFDLSRRSQAKPDVGCSVFDVRISLRRSRGWKTPPTKAGFAFLAWRPRRLGGVRFRFAGLPHVLIRVFRANVVNTFQPLFRDRFNWSGGSCRSRTPSLPFAHPSFPFSAPAHPWLKRRCLRLLSALVAWWCHQLPLFAVEGRPRRGRRSPTRALVPPPALRFASSALRCSTCPGVARRSRMLDVRCSMFARGPRSVVAGN